METGSDTERVRSFHFSVVNFQNVPINLTNFVFLIGHISNDFENQKTKKTKNHGNNEQDLSFFVGTSCKL